MLLMVETGAVAITASPTAGFDRFATRTRSDDPDVKWIIRETLEQYRMRKADPGRFEAIDRLLGRAVTAATR